MIEKVQIKLENMLILIIRNGPKLSQFRSTGFSIPFGPQGVERVKVGYFSLPPRISDVASKAFKNRRELIDHIGLDVTDHQLIDNISKRTKVRVNHQYL